MADDKEYAFLKVGEVRPSQMTHTYGVGALVELPYLSVIVRSHEKWRPIRDDVPPELVMTRPVSEPRLLAAVRHELGSTVEQLKMPPRMASSTTKSPRADKANWVGVWGWPFPRWLRCGRCGMMARIEQDMFKWEIDPNRPHDAGFFHEGCYRGNVDIRATPVRVVMACENGHLDDFPWVEWAHRHTGHECPTGHPNLKLHETGFGDRPTSLAVQCLACNTPKQSIEPLFAQQAPRPACRGFYAHIPQWDPRGCKRPATPMLVGASNMWFAERRSVLSIPGPHDEARRFVEENWKKLKKASSLDQLQHAADPEEFAAIPALVDATIDLSLIWDVIQEKAQEVAEPDPDADPPDLLQPEWDTFQQDGEKNTSVFSMHPADAPTGHESLLLPTRQMTRLREVVALIGFTRIGRNDNDDGLSVADEGDDNRYARAPLTWVLDPKGDQPARALPKWVPVAESLGEGVLIRFDEDRMQQWEDTADAHPRMIAMQEAHRAWRKARNAIPDVNVPYARQVLLHTFSHLLMSQMSKDAGYNTASIAERIYCRPPDHPGGPMAGVLLYTAEPDAEGTLGGLVSLGEADTLGRLIDTMLDEAAVCSTDPYCSEHEPTHNESALHGAACYSCLFVPETSCDMANRYLDRSFVVDTFSVDDLAYFAR